MPQILRKIVVRGITYFYRPNTSDLNVIKEVVETKTYQRPRIGLVVEQEEKWLDLGAHIGSFSLYAGSLGATVTAYEPNVSCFKILEKNILYNKLDVQARNLAVTSLTQKRIRFWESISKKKTTRGTTIDQSNNVQSKFVGLVDNMDAAAIVETFDGVKMDIEGAEFGIIDSLTIPKCNKLCLEYHTSRDPSLENFRRRLEILKSIFSIVSYRPSIDAMISRGGDIPKGMANLDRVIYCMK